MEHRNLAQRPVAQRMRLLPFVALLLGGALFWPGLVLAQSGEPTPDAPVFDPAAEAVMPAEELLPDADAATDVDSAPTEAVLDVQLVAETGATCRAGGTQDVTITQSWNTWVSAVYPTRPQSPPLQAGMVISANRSLPLWTLVKFNYNRNAVPNHSELCGARILMNKSSVRGGFNPAAYAMNAEWPSNATYSGVSGHVGGYIGNSSGGGTVSINAGSVAQNWLNNPSQNHGFVVQSNGGANAAILSNPKLQLTVHCDFYAPWAWMNTSPDYSKPGTKVHWDGKDDPDPSSPGCIATKVANYHVWYTTRAPGESEDQTAWSTYYQGSSRSLAFEHSVADGTRVNFRVCATDHAGNIQTNCSEGGATTIDNKAPAIQLDPPLEQYTYASNFEVRWQAIDVVSGPKSCKVRYRVDNGSWHEEGGEPVGGGDQHHRYFRHRVFNGVHGQRYDFEILCRDNVDNVTTHATTASTTVWLHPDAGMSNITPNFVGAQHPFRVAWHGYEPQGSSPLASFDVYYRQPGQAWQHTAFNADTRSAAFPFDGSTPAPGLWEFEVTATNEKGGTTPVRGVAEATAVVGHADTGGMVYLPAVAKK